MGNHGERRRLGGYPDGGYPGGQKMPEPALMVKEVLEEISSETGSRMFEVQEASSRQDLYPDRRRTARLGVDQILAKPPNRADLGLEVLLAQLRQATSH